MYLKAGHLYTLLIGETVSEFRLFCRRTQMNDFNDFSTKLHAWKCPACPQVQKLAFLYAIISF